MSQLQWLESRTGQSSWWLRALLKWDGQPVTRCFQCAGRGLNRVDHRVPCMTCRGLGMVPRKVSQ